ncbi:MAG: hypothetical protein JNJ78_15145 [Anaerolineae bacterium]|nr:hypothetical protein [Anaerolineae bacterium]
MNKCAYHASENINFNLNQSPDKTHGGSSTNTRLFGAVTPPPPPPTPSNRFAGGTFSLLQGSFPCRQPLPCFPPDSLSATTTTTTTNAPLGGSLSVFPPFLTAAPLLLQNPSSKGRNLAQLAFPSYNLAL